MYSVNYWGSHPDANNDDCWTGLDFESRFEALEAFANTPTDALGHARWDKEVAYVEVDGKDLHRVRRNPLFKPDRDEGEDRRREIAQEAGMLHGVEAYNEVMGWN